MKKITLNLLIVVFTMVSLHAQNTSKLKAEEYLSTKGELTFTFQVENHGDVSQYTQSLSIVNYDKNTKTVIAWANENQFRNFEARNIAYQVPENENEVDESVIYDNSTFTTRSTLNTLTFPVATYPTYAQYVQQMQDFMDDYPALVETFSIGPTTEGDKELLFVKISDNVSVDEQEPKLMFTSSIHGDEIAGYPMMLSLIEHILTVYNNPNPGNFEYERIKNLVENAEIWINPNANPDGTYYGSSTNTSVTGSRRANSNGFDLNRNYPDNVNGPHSNGHTAYELETQHFMNMADNNHFVISANFHGGVELVNYPFDNAYATNTVSHSEAPANAQYYTHPDGNWFEFICAEYATHAQNDSSISYMTVDYDSYIYASPGVTHGAEWYLVYGGRQDYMNYYHQCRETTIELSTTKILPESQLVNYWNYNKNALLDYLTQGTYGFTGVVKDASTGNPIENATVTLVGHDAYGSHTVTDINFGDYYRPVKAGTYTILFEADCYQSFELTDQTINDGQTIVLSDVNLTPIASTPPANLTVSNLLDTTATISWDAITGANYDYQYKETSSATWLPLVNTSNNSIDLTGLTAETEYEVQVRSTCNSNTSSWSTSEIFTTIAPPPCDFPDNLTVSNVTPTSATLSWGANSGANYDYRYHTLGSSWPTELNTSNISENLTGLTENTHYEVQVRSLCNSETSTWSNSIFFTTTTTPPCTNLFDATYPYTQSFENAGGSIGDWTQDTSDDFNWIIKSGGTGTNNTGPSNANDGSYYIYTEANNQSGKNAIINSPCFNLNNKTSATFSFDYHMYGGQMGSLTLQYSINNGLNWYELWSLSGNQGTTWNSVSTINLTPYVGNYLRLRFIGTPAGNRSDMAIDNINLNCSNELLTYNNGWSPSEPSSTTGAYNALIQAGTYTIGSDIKLNDVTINPLAEIEISNGQSLTLNGDLVNNGILTLNSDSNSYSSLIVNGTGTGDVQYKRHVNAYNGVTGNDLISAPVVGQSFGDFATDNPNIFENPSSGLEHNKLFGHFDKTDGEYKIYSSTNHASVTLDSGVGYRAARDSAEDGNANGTNFVFSGSVNTGFVNIGISNSGPYYQEWNLIGNPYPSYIDPIDFIATNFAVFNSNNVAIYGYDGDASNGWTIINSANASIYEITPGQGFFVASDLGGTVTFTPSMRTLGSSDDFILGKNSSITYLKLEVNSSSENYETDFYFTDNASLGLDPGYDASVFGGVAPSFAIYSQLVNDNQGIDMAIQSVSNTDLSNNVIIPLGINANQGQQLTVSIIDTTLPENTNVYLEDNVTNTTTLLNTNNYVFTPDTNLSDVGRFILRFETETLSAIENELNELVIYNTISPKVLHVKGQLTDSATLYLYDIHGRIVLTEQLKTNTNSQQIDLSNIGVGVYFAKIASNNTSIVKKLIIQ